MAVNRHLVKAGKATDPLAYGLAALSAAWNFGQAACVSGISRDYGHC